jgi:hypothetical protein
MRGTMYDYFVYTVAASMQDIGVWGSDVFEFMTRAGNLIGAASRSA